MQSGNARRTAWRKICKSCWIASSLLLILLLPPHDMGVSATGDEGPALVDACRHHTAYYKKARCYQKKLEAIMQTQGTEQALVALKFLAAEDPEILQRANQYAHFLGWRSFAHYKDVSVAFSHCRDTFSSGCYHGVLQAYLGSLSPVTPEAIATVCDKQVQTAQSSTFLRHQCLHGLGHGLTTHFEYDLKKALSFCDMLPMDWDRGSCYGGVFMENVVAAQNAHHYEQYTGRKADKLTVLQPRDPLYPCNTVAKKYQHACYQMQSSAILTLTRHNYSQAFHICSKAPDEFASVCYESLGREISGVSLRNEQKIIALCGEAEPEAMTACVVGAVKDIILAHADPQRGLSFCRNLEAPRQRIACFTAAGQVLATLYPDAKQRDTACAIAEEPYAAICRAAAPHL